MTKDKWDSIYDYSIYKFFNLVSFVREYKRREQEAIKEWQRKH